MGYEKIKDFIKTFNLGVRKKLINPENQEINPKLLARMLDIYADRDIAETIYSEQPVVEQDIDISFNF